MFKDILARVADVLATVLADVLPRPTAAQPVYQSYRAAQMTDAYDLWYGATPFTGERRGGCASDTYHAR